MNVESLLAAKGTKVLESEKYEFVKIKDLYKEIGNNEITVDKIYSTKSKFGLQYVIVATEIEKRVNIPKHLTNIVEDLIICDNYSELVKEAKLKFLLYEYETDLGKFVGLTFIAR